MDLSPVLDILTTAKLRELNDRVLAEGAMRARCMVVPVDPTTALCRVLGRYKMYVDLRDTGFAPHLMFEGYWEYWVTDFIWRTLRPGQVALDLGANHGYYTVLMADLVGAGGQVHAFEPNPRLVELLGLTIAVNGFWSIATTHAVAVGDAAEGGRTFVASVRDPKNGALWSTGHALPPEQPQLAVHAVPVVTLDAAVPGRADFVKVDVEGAEEAVWRGMQGLIARSPGIGILMEFNPRRCRDPRATLAEMARQFPLREVGFDARVVPCDAATVLERTEDTMLWLSEAETA